MEGRKSIPLHGPGLIEVCRGEIMEVNFLATSQWSPTYANNENLICEYLGEFFFWLDE
jgi:hypothetical protein